MSGPPAPAPSLTTGGMLAKKCAGQGRPRTARGPVPRECHLHLKGCGGNERTFRFKIGAGHLEGQENPPDSARRNPGGPGLRSLNTHPIWVIAGDLGEVSEQRSAVEFEVIHFVLKLVPHREETSSATPDYHHSSEDGRWCSETREERDHQGNQDQREDRKINPVKEDPSKSQSRESPFDII